MSDDKRIVAGVEIPRDDTYAFPFHAATTGPTGTVYVTCAGMTLRDWFAGQAIAGMLAHGPVPGGKPETFAAAAYSVADALITTRGGK
jgi:hypothetical protein